jgi:hypothetical protein
MLSQRHLPSFVRWMAVSLIVFALLLAFSSDASAQGQLFNNNRAVGGISCDPSGQIANIQLGDQSAFVKLMQQHMQPIPGDIKAPGTVRVSLRQLEAAIEKHGDKIPDEIRYLGGLQQIQYVFVYPKQQDIVLVGFGEGWKVNKQGFVVGITTGKPVMLLDDLLVALRSAKQAAQGGISCSIDPTPEGLNRLRAVTSRMRTVGNPERTSATIASALGKQKITFTGVPTDSHFARVLVAADYRMKRLAMNFEKSPVAGLPSFMSMMSGSGRGMNNMLPRWWLEPNYEPILRSADGMAWEFRDAGVRAMTEEDFLKENGDVQHTGRANPLAQKWADNMTAKFDELSAVEPIFGQMRNCMELAVVSALIVKERLPHKAGYSMPLLMNPAEVKVTKFNTPSQVDSQVSMMKKGRSWVFSASGGVLINSWAIADKVQESDAPGLARNKSIPKGDAWRWN